MKTAVIKSSNQSQSVTFIILSVSDSIITLLHEGTFSRKLRNNRVIDCSLFTLLTVMASSYIDLIPSKKGGVRVSIN